MNLLTAFEEITPLSQACKNALSSIITLSSFDSDIILHNPQQINDTVYFVNSGILRVYYYSDAVGNDNDDKTITARFVCEGEFAAVATTLFLQEPSNDYIETLESCQLSIIRFGEFKKLLLQFPELHICLYSMYQQYLIQYEKELRFFRYHNHEKMYDRFDIIYPKLSNRVKLKHIASFLGMTQQHLSRLRKKLASCNKKII